LNKRTWVIFLVSAALVITALATYLLFTSREAEHKLRLAKEAELSIKTAEVTEKQAQVQTLIQQKSDLEEQFTTKIATLESSLKDYDENSRAINAKMESVLRENEAIKRELADKDAKIGELTRKIRSLEADKTSLLETLNKSTAAAAAKTTAAADAQSAGSGLTYDYVDPEALDSVKLGKIVVQKTSGRAARVDYIDKLYGFIVINAGANDGMKKDAVVNIIRGNKLIGKAVVQKIRAEVSAAVIISEWTREEVKIGDQVSRFS